MDEDGARQRIRQKLGTGRLPRIRALDIRVVPAEGQLCDACEQPIERRVQAVWTVRNNDGPLIQLHEDCFQIWQAETNGVA